MKRFLRGRWHSIPVALLSALLAIVLIAGGVFAWYSAWSYTATVDVQEPIVVYDAAYVADNELTWEGWQSLKELPDTIWPGEGACAIYLIHNEGNAPLDIKVTTTEPAGTSECGLSLLWANSSADMLRCDGGACEPIVLNTPEGPHELTWTFTIGTYEYLGGGDPGGISGGELYDAGKGDSSFVKLYVGFLVNGDAEPGPFDLKITVERDTAS